ncbi:hypothetical protein EI172_14090 [Psychrobacter sp. FME2]|nr:hypothetical protein [Pseudomonas lundensis]
MAAYSKLSTFIDFVSISESLGNSHGLVSAQNPANQSNGAWVKKDPERFTKCPVQEYLDDERAPRF